jgi:hypothetical protein
VVCVWSVARARPGGSRRAAGAGRACRACRVYGLDRHQLRQAMSHSAGAFDGGRPQQCSKCSGRRSGDYGQWGSRGLWWQARPGHDATNHRDRLALARAPCLAMALWRRLRGRRSGRLHAGRRCQAACENRRPLYVLYACSGRAAPRRRPSCTGRSPVARPQAVRGACAAVCVPWHAINITAACVVLPTAGDWQATALPT